MKKLFLFFVAIILIPISFSWLNSSWSYCRNIKINETAGIPRLEEPIEIFLDTSDWDHVPKKNSIRIVRGGCDEQGNEIPYGLWNETYNDRDLLQSFNLVFTVNATGNKENYFSIYYDDKELDKPMFNGIEWLEPRYDWRIRTEYYDLDYHSSDGRIGFKDFRYIRDGDKTDYTGIAPGPRPQWILRFSEEEELDFIYNTSVCLKFNISSFENFLECMTCHKLMIITCENDGGNETHFANTILRDIFYDPDSQKKLYYMTNEDQEPKSSDLISGYHKYRFRYGVANTTLGTNFISIVTDGSSDWSTVVNWHMSPGPPSNNRYGNLPALENLTKFKSTWVAITNESLEKAYERAANWSIAIDHPLEQYVTLGEVQTFSRTNISLSSPSNHFVEQDLTLTPKIFQNEQPIKNLTKDDFNIYLDGNPLTKENFQNWENGSYSFDVETNPSKLGRNNLKLNLTNYDSEIQKRITILNQPPERVLIITKNNWKDYITSVSTNRPTLIYESSRKLIDKYVQEYNPQVIYQLGTNLNFKLPTYQVDSRETLIKILTPGKKILIPSNKKTALKSSFIDASILFLYRE